MGSWLCPDCYEQIEFFAQPLPLTLENNHLDQLVAMAEYQAPISQLLHVYKYQSVAGIGSLLAEMLYYTTLIPEHDVITAVPLHARRFNERGFNQAELIAKQLATFTHTPYVSLLSRTQFSAPQATITNQAERLVRLKKSFALNPINTNPAHTNVLIIDDVTTTGTTINECAAILKTAGYSKVRGLVISHGG